MSTAKFNQWLNSDGTENYKCRAWVNFNGTGTVAIRASGNVSSITDNGTGNYTVNFTTAMPDANYAIAGSAEAGVTNGIVVSQPNSATRTTSASQIITDRNTSGVLDCTFVSVAFFR